MVLLICTTPPPTGKFGLHSNDASRVYERELLSGEKALEWWHPGKLLHYGRAELKTSDHRPVMAIIEIDVFRVDERKKKAVIEEVESSLGPTDPTVEVAVDGQEKNTVDITLLLELLQECGNIVLVRWVGACVIGHGAKLIFLPSLEQGNR